MLKCNTLPLRSDSSSRHRKFFRYPECYHALSRIGNTTTNFREPPLVSKARTERRQGRVRAHAWDRNRMANKKTFSGTLHVKILEASALKPPTIPGGITLTTIDPYVRVSYDDIFLEQTKSKDKTTNPLWNEEIEGKLYRAENLEITVFHKSLVPPEPFVANVSIPFEEILSGSEKGHFQDYWVN